MHLRYTPDLTRDTFWRSCCIFFFFFKSSSIKILQDNDVRTYLKERRFPNIGKTDENVLYDGKKL